MGAGSCSRWRVPCCLLLVLRGPKIYRLKLDHHKDKAIEVKPDMPELDIVTLQEDRSAKTKKAPKNPKRIRKNTKPAQKKDPPATQDPVSEKDDADKAKTEVNTTSKDPVKPKVKKLGDDEEPRVPKINKLD